MNLLIQKIICGWGVVVRNRKWQYAISNEERKKRAKEVRKKRTLSTKGELIDK